MSKIVVLKNEMLAILQADSAAATKLLELFDLMAVQIGSKQTATQRASHRFREG